ncbi:MAG: nitroreductase family protein, partial [Actinomycetota bacterium]|nr:nitroreductase family protein [Actinomycetota bacterium]
MSAALAYHAATNAPAGGTDEVSVLDPATRPHPFKDYRDADRLPLETSVAGPVLSDGAGVVRSRETGWGTIWFRGYSSAGALYPVEAYAATPVGLLSFDALGRSFARVRADDVRSQLAAAAADPRLADAGAILVLTGIPARTGWKYGERGYRHIWWDAGTLLANVLALAAADGLRPQLRVAFVDEDVNQVLRVDGLREYALALIALGGEAAPPEANIASNSLLLVPSGPSFPLAERAHAASSLDDADAVRGWRAGQGEDEPALARDELVRAIRRRGSVRRYAPDPLPRPELATLLAWS